MSGGAAGGEPVVRDGSSVHVSRPSPICVPQSYQLSPAAAGPVSPVALLQYIQ